MQVDMYCFLQEKSKGAFTRAGALVRVNTVYVFNMLCPCSVFIFFLLTNLNFFDIHSPGQIYLKQYFVRPKCYKETRIHAMF